MKEYGYGTRLKTTQELKDNIRTVIRDIHTFYRALREKSIVCILVIFIFWRIGYYSILERSRQTIN